MRVGKARSAGFTVVELAVGIGIAGIVGVAATQFFFDKTRAGRSAELSTEFTQLVSTLGVSLTHLPTCTAMLGGKSFNAATLAPASGSKPLIRVTPLRLGGQTLTENAPASGLTIQRLGFDRVIQDLGLHASGNRGYLVNLKLVAAKSASGGEGMSSDFTVPLYVDTVANVIRGCEDTAISLPPPGSCGVDLPLENRCFVDASGAMDEGNTASSCMAYATSTGASDHCAAGPTSCTSWAGKLRCCYDICPGP